MNDLSGIGGSNFQVYLAGYTTLANGKKEALIIALDHTGALLDTFTAIGTATYDIDGDDSDGSGSSEFTHVRYRDYSLYLSGNLNDGQDKHFVTRIKTTGGAIDSASYATDSNGIRKIVYDDDTTIAIAQSIDNISTNWISGYHQADNKRKIIISAVDSNGQLLNGDGDFTSGKHTIEHTSIPSDDKAVKVIKIANGEHQGKYLVAANAKTTNSNNIVLSRYTSAGVLDTNFDTDGHKQVKLGTDADVSALIELNTGGFIIYGTVSENSVTNGVIAKLDNNANLDTSFATHGIYTTDSITASSITFSHGGIDSTNKIIAIGRLESGSISPIVLRLTADGVIDSTFNDVGYATGSVTDQYNSLVIDNMNNIIVAGNRNIANKGVIVVKYTNSGVIDNSFANAGMYYEDIDINADDYITKILADDSDNLYLIGNTLATPNSVLAIKLSSTGNLVTSFAGNGIGTFVIPTSNNVEVLDARLDSDNNIAIIGYADLASKNTPMLGRIKANGTLDSTFNSSGFFTTNSCTDAAQLTSLLLLEDTKLVVAGYCFVDSNLKNNLEFAQYQLLEP